MSGTAYYPSLVVNFMLRFDEALTTVKYDKPSEVQQPAADPQVAFQPLVTSDNLSQVMGIIPKQATVELPGYRQAGKFNLTLEYKDFPIDPRAIRAARVEIHLGAIEAGAFGSGITHAPTDGSGLRSSILNTRDAQNNPREDTLLMLGTVDSIDSTHDASGSQVHLEGRDLRGILLDSPVTAGVIQKLMLDKPIDAVVKQIINEHPRLKEQLDKGTFKIVVDNSQWPGGVMPVVTKDVVTRTNLDAEGKKASISTKGNADSGNFWDLVTQFCFLVGAIPWFKGRQLRIDRARSLYDQARAGEEGKPTPFKDGKPRSVTVYKNGQKVEELPALKLRRLAYGADILSFKMERKLGGKKVPKVMVVSTNTSSTKRGYEVLIGEYPKPDDKTATHVSPEGDVAEQEVLRIPIAGIAEKGRLEQMAEDIYHEVGRGEMGGSVSTKDLASFGGSNQDPDLLFLRPGDAVEVVSATTTKGARPAIVSELSQHDARSQQAEEDAIAKRLGDRNLARVLVATARNTVPQLQRIFRVKDVKFNWAAASGVSIDFDFTNFVEIRHDKNVHTAQGTKLED